MNFIIDKEKAVEALLYIVSRYGEVGRFHALKTLYFAEREHLRSFGRPIVGDRFIAMDNGPVPSYAYDALKQTVPEPERAMVAGAISPAEGAFSHPKYKPHRDPDLSFFSKTDLRCLDWAIAHCKGRSFGDISDETHLHLAWKNAPLNGVMSADDMLDGVSEDIKEEAEMFASYGVL
ncbi:Panacea domain-containing protein [Brucella intermedia]|uniref:Panacea domain-containing protein n=1 Tax=Brucella intermedia TaxID=94625 RepID=UPI0022497CFB|nr:Panacea domain-containing protein [Brucella intermedia]